MKKTVLAIAALLILCVLIASAEGASVLKIGDKGDTVLELNTRLRQLNYTMMRATDQYTESTVKAVQAVQAAYGLPETGEADEATLKIIYGECYRALKNGDSGSDVRALQEKLLELGYYTGNVSGNYLEGTAAAVKVFQGENSLKITGIADVATQEKLFSFSVRPTPTPTPVPTPAPKRTPTPAPGPYQTYPGEMKKGSTGPNVAKVQQRLMDLGFFTFYKTTNNYMDKTVQAVKDFQKHNGLEVTGKIDQITWDTLFNDTDVRGIGDEKQPEYVLPYFFEVDVRNQVVKVWKYNRKTGKYSDLDRAFICSTGTTAYPSPLGTFKLTGRRSIMCVFPQWGGGQARWWTPITDEIAFHSVLYGQWDDDSTMKVSSFKGLGKRGSHGCIRLTVADAHWIYDNAKAGMEVWIHDDAEDDPELRYKVKPGELNPKNNLPYTTPAPPEYPAYNGKKPPEKAERSLSIGKEGEDVYWLQMKLKELGFYKGTVTGQYREGTQSAVKAYQRSRKLEVDGVASKKMLNYLYDEVRQANKKKK